MNLGDSGLICEHRMVVERLRVAMSDEEHGMHLETEPIELRITAGVIALIAGVAAEERSDDEVI